MNINWINYGHTGNSRREVSDVIRIVNNYLDQINFDANPYEGIASAFLSAELIRKQGGHYVFTGRRTPARARDLSLLPEMLSNLADDMEGTWNGLSPMQGLLMQFRGTPNRAVTTPYLDPDRLRIAKLFLERIA